MNSNTIMRLRIVPAVVLGLLLLAGVAAAQPSSNSDKSKDKSSTSSKKTDTDATPTSTTTGDEAGDYIVTSSFEVGYRGLGVYGDERKYRSDLGYKAGPRLFDSSFLMRAKEGKGGLFDTLLVTATGWGADPTSSMRLSAEKPEWYRLEANYRRAKYYRFLNNVVNPNWIFGTYGGTNFFTVPPSSVTGQHGYNTRTEFGDFDLTLFPKSEWIRLNIGYSPEHYSGPFFTNYHQGRQEFQAMVDSRTRANDLRLGAEGTIGKVDWTITHGIRWYKDDSVIATVPAYINPNPLTNSSAVARYTSFQRDEPTRSRVDFTRLSAHTLLAKRFDITGRFIYSKATANSVYLENQTGVNFNTGFSGQTIPNTLLVGYYNIPSSASRPNTQGDVGLTILATDNLRISNTFHVEDFTINGIGNFNDIFSVRLPTSVVNTQGVTNLQAFTSTQYRKYTNTIEGDYQFNPRYSVHLGYRYGHRRDQVDVSGYELNSNSPSLIVPPDHELEENTTHSILGGFRMRPTKSWTVYFDGERGTADNVFTRIGNYDYTNLRAKTRWVPNRKINLNVGFIFRDNSNPSEIAGEALGDFDVKLKTRIFQSSLDWVAKDNLSISFGYNYNWVDSDATIDYVYTTFSGTSTTTNTFHHFGHALYFQRNNFFYTDVVWRPNWRVSVYGSYRVNLDNGQGNRLSDPTGGTPIPGGIIVNGSNKPIANEGGTLITSYPMSYQSPEGRVAIRINRHLDWNLGYQYFNYNEDGFLKTFPLNAPRAQNYHAHLPYMSLRIYIGRKE